MTRNKIKRKKSTKKSRKRRFFRKKRTLSLAQQKLVLTRLGFTNYCEIHNGQLHWSGQIRPTPFSNSYEVRILYKIGKAPDIYLYDSNGISGIDRADFPHYFKKSESRDWVQICVYKADEFTKYKYIAKTLVMWSAEWLYHFECWLYTGKWEGGGHEIR